MSDLTDLVKDVSPGIIQNNDEPRFTRVINLLAADPRIGGLNHSNAFFLAHLHNLQSFVYAKKLDSEGFFYQGREDLAMATSIDFRSADRITKFLVKHGFLETVVKRVENSTKTEKVRHFKVNSQAIDDRLNILTEFYKLCFGKHLNWKEKTKLWTLFAAKKGVPTFLDTAKIRYRNLATEDYSVKKIKTEDCSVDPEFRSDGSKIAKIILSLVKDGKLAELLGIPCSDGDFNPNPENLDFEALRTIVVLLSNLLKSMDEDGIKKILMSVPLRTHVCTATDTIKTLSKQSFKNDSNESFNRFESRELRSRLSSPKTRLRPSGLKPVSSLRSDTAPILASLGSDVVSLSFDSKTDCALVILVALASLVLQGLPKLEEPMTQDKTNPCPLSQSIGCLFFNSKELDTNPCPLSQSFSCLSNNPKGLDSNPCLLPTKVASREEKRQEKTKTCSPIQGVPPFDEPLPFAPQGSAPRAAGPSEGSSGTSNTVDLRFSHKNTKHIDASGTKTRTTPHQGIQASKNHCTTIGKSKDPSPTLLRRKLRPRPLALKEAIFEDQKIIPTGEVMNPKQPDLSKDGNELDSKKGRNPFRHTKCIYRDSPQTGKGPSEGQKSLREEMETAFRKKSAIEKRDAKVTKPNETKRTVEKIFAYWQKQKPLRTHRITKPESKTVKRAKQAIESTIKGTFGINHPDFKKGTKYNFNQWKNAIDEAVRRATDFSYTESTRRWYKKMGIDDFIFTGAVPDPNADKVWQLESMSPFLSCLAGRKTSRFQTTKYGKLVDDEKLIENAFYYCNEFLEQRLRLTDSYRFLIAKFLTKLKVWASFNEYGLCGRFKELKNLYRPFIEMVLDGENYADHKPLFWSSSYDKFLDYCINHDMIFDERNGRLFGEHTDTYWFQLTNEERQKVIDDEKAMEQYKEYQKIEAYRLYDEEEARKKANEVHYTPEEIAEKERWKAKFVVWRKDFEILRPLAYKQGWGAEYEKEKNKELNGEKDMDTFIAWAYARVAEEDKKQKKAGDKS